MRRIAKYTKAQERATKLLRQWRLRARGFERRFEMTDAQIEEERIAAHVRQVRAVQRRLKEAKG